MNVYKIVLLCAIGLLTIIEVRAGKFMSPLIEIPVTIRGSEDSQAKVDILLEQGDWLKMQSNNSSEWGEKFFKMSDDSVIAYGYNESDIQLTFKWSNPDYERVYKACNFDISAWRRAVKNDAFDGGKSLDAQAYNQQYEQWSELVEFGFGLARLRASIKDDALPTQAFMKDALALNDIVQKHQDLSDACKKVWQNITEQFRYCMYDEVKNQVLRPLLETKNFVFDVSPEVMEFCATVCEQDHGKEMLREWLKARSQDSINIIKENLKKVSVQGDAEVAAWQSIQKAINAQLTILPAKPAEASKDDLKKKSHEDTQKKDAGTFFNKALIKKAGIAIAITAVVAVAGYYWYAQQAHADENAEQ